MLSVESRFVCYCMDIVDGTQLSACFGPPKSSNLYDYHRLANSCWSFRLEQAKHWLAVFGIE